MTVILFLFCVFLFLILWTFAFYPVLIKCMGILWASPWAEGVFVGKASLIIAAHNEEEVIRNKVENCLKLTCGQIDLEAIIVSDGSIDSTDKILEEFNDTSKKLKIIIYHPRSGKANALNIGEKNAAGEILIFSDANVIVEENSIPELLSPFTDPSVGVVCGKVYVRGCGDEEIAGESLYMKIEGMIQMAEAKFGSMIGVDGAFFAIRRELFRPLSSNLILDDFALSMEAPMAGMRIVYAENAKAVEEMEASVRNEFRRKTRIIAGGYQYLSWLAQQKPKFGCDIWFSLISRKIIRWLTPLLMIGLIACNIILMQTLFYHVFFATQSVFYLLAALGHFLPSLRQNYFFYLPYYFCVINIASLVGLLRFLTQKQNILWDKVNR